MNQIKTCINNLIFITLLITFCLYSLPSHAQNADDNTVDTNVVQDDMEGQDTGQVSGVEASDLMSWSFHSPYFSGSLSKEFKLSNRTRLGFTHAAGNTRSFLIGLDNTLTASKGVLVNVLESTLLYGQSSSDPTLPLAENYRLFQISDQLEWHHTKKIYSFTKWNYAHNRPSGYDHIYQGSLGAGYFIIDKTALVWRSELSYLYTHQDQIDPLGTANLHAAVLGTSFVWSPNSWTSWQNELAVIENIKHGYDIQLSYSSNLNFRLVKNLSMGIGFTLNYDNRPVLGFKKYDTVSSVSMALQI
jgi:hypothetical protein